ncbi:MAG TPA: UdgX family uracil-DNA binding protein [Caulobacteraceae bacterium]|nr:UdgX family uracil-DNA binding protein [Caulobacteraceae bacterium]
MVEVVLPGETDFDAWRTSARRLRLAGIEPARVQWRVGEGSGALFDGQVADAPPGQPFTAPRAFLDLAGEVLLHRSAHRLDLLYRLLWRLREEPRLVEIVTDPEVAEAQRMAKSVRQAIHKMHAFVRFRRVEGEAEETYVAWFEPPHRVALASADYFVRRMANLRFSILTPDVAVHWDGQALTSSPPIANAAPADDRLEDLWRAYYSAVFNPARLNPKAMTQHMARRYWRNLPEATLIQGLVGQARERTHAMVQADPTKPAPRAARIARQRSAVPALDPAAEPDTLTELAAAVNACRRCDLWRDATQGVPGEGPRQARLMLVGEQPGDQEDLAGHPFVGPAGAILDRALAEAGAPREDFYVTNAVKHFKHELRGKRRLHKTPNAGEVSACRWWLDHERRLVKPKVIVALGATAAKAVLGRPVSVIRERGEAGLTPNGERAFVTVHPSYLLRLPDEAAKAAAYTHFVRDLRAAYALSLAA